MEEQLLIAGCKRGESLACKKIYEAYAPMMLSVCYRYVNERATAEDLLQDGFIKIFTKINQYSERDGGSFGGWIRRVFVTTCLEHLRQKNALKNGICIDNYIDTLETVEISVLDQLSNAELLNCITKLPEGYRTVLNLYAIEGYSHKEIAELLNIEESTSRSQFARAKKILQKNIELILNYEYAGK